VAIVLNRIQLAEVMRVATLSLVTFIALSVSWQLASMAAAGRAQTDDVARVAPAPRGLEAETRYSVERESVRSSSAGELVVFSLGTPLTVVDGPVTVPLRVPRGTTVEEALELASITLGPLDRVAGATREDGGIRSGDVVRVIRVVEENVVAQEAIPFAVTTVADSSLTSGKTAVKTPGVAGLAEATYRVRTADGVEEARTLLARIELRAPVAEVRLIGTRPVVAPAVPGDIQAIIQDAAAKWGADPTQLLRVAYCESRYNPNAYNASSGASGLFQFLATTWAPNSVRAGYAGASVFDPVANANTAAYMFSRGQAAQWQCK
jgi:hypothetical protein